MSTADTREMIDAELQSMLWGAEAGNNAQAAQLIRALLDAVPSTPIDGEWSRFIERLLEIMWPHAWHDVDRDAFACAMQISLICNAAVKHPTPRLPSAVQKILDEQYSADHHAWEPAKQRKAQKGSLGAAKQVAGAIAMAKGWHKGPVDTAGQWVLVDRKMIDLGARAGLTFPGLGNRRRSQVTVTS